MTTSGQWSASRTTAHATLALAELSTPPETSRPEDPAATSSELRPGQRSEPLTKPRPTPAGSRGSSVRESVKTQRQRDRLRPDAAAKSAKRSLAIRREQVRYD